jgi:hypothetical protein
MPAGLCLLIELQKFSVGTHKLLEFRPGECAKLRGGFISWDEMDNQAGICPREDELQLRAPARVATLPCWQLLIDATFAFKSWTNSRSKFVHDLRSRFLRYRTDSGQGYRNLLKLVPDFG